MYITTCAEPISQTFSSHSPGKAHNAFKIILTRRGPDLKTVYGPTQEAAWLVATNSWPYTDDTSITRKIYGGD